MKPEKELLSLAPAEVGGEDSPAKGKSQMGLQSARGEGRIKRGFFKYLPSRTGESI